MPIMKNYLLAAIAAGWLACAAAAPAADWTTTGNVTLVSDYIFRGISQTQHRPTWQMGLEAAHASGWYVGTFGSGVSNAAYTNSSGAEIDLYGGWRGDFGAAGNVDLGVVTYWYPGARYVGGDGATIHFHTQELKAAYNYGTFNVTGWVSPDTSWFGIAYDPNTGERRDTAGTAYVEANWNPALADALTLNLHVGAQRFQGVGAYDFDDAKIGLTYVIGHWSLAAAVTHNDGRVTQDGKPVWTFFDADGTGRNVAGTRALLTAAYGF